MWLRLLTICGLMALPLAALAEEAVLDPGLSNPGYQDKPDWFKNSFLDLREDIEEASAAGKRVVLYFYQDGCPYCKKLLEINLSQHAIVEKMKSGFDVIAINMWGDREVRNLNGDDITEKVFASQLRVMFTPTMLFLDEDGRVVLRMNGYFPPHRFLAALDYAADPAATASSFTEYLQRTAPVAAQGELHQDSRYLQEPYHLDTRTGDRPLAVLFEQRECPACDELHQDILKREESEALLNRFDVVLLDMWSKTPLVTPDGITTTVSEWAKALNVQYAPTVVLFDAEGQEVFRAEAYLKAFHVQSVLDYVASGAYRTQPSFQRYIQARAEALEAQGIHIDLMK